MIVDACLFADEAKVLELRIRTLAKVVDRFVVVACTLTHQAEPVDQDRTVEAFEDATVRTAHLLPPDVVSLHWVEPDPLLDRGQGVRWPRPSGHRGGARTPWYQHIERQHRDGVKAAVTGDPETVVMLSDVDEIPAPSAVDAIRATRRAGPFVFEQRFHSTALEWLHPIQPWLGTVAGRLGDLDPTGWRNGRGDFHSAGQIVRMGGWHFSWLGTDDERARKLDTFSHAELRGQFDPADGRRGGYHANGERLVEIADVDMDRIDWPVPIIDGTFEVPADWFRNASAFR